MDTRQTGPPSGNSRNSMVPQRTTRTKKRNKLSYTCANCRRKKIKCDRNLPCQNCIKAKITDTCEYSVPPPYQPYPILLQQQNYNQNEQLGPPPLPQQQHSNGARPQSITFNLLKNQMDQLKNQLSSLENVMKTGGATSGIDSSGGSPVSNESLRQYNNILDLKLDALKTPRLSAKPSRLSYQGPMSIFSFMDTTFNSYTISIFRGFIEKERIARKLKTGFSTTKILRLIHCEADENEVILDIKKYVVPHCARFLQRILYFRDHLNELLYYKSIDIPHVFECFNKYFKKAENGQYIFIKPEKPYYYSELSMIFSIVNLSITFAKHDDHDSFNAHFDSTTEDVVCLLAAKTLSLSQFYRKHSYSSIISLILIQDIYFSYEQFGAMDQTKQFSLLNNAIGIAYQIGLHRNPTTITAYYSDKHKKNVPYRMPVLNQRAIWSCLKLMDANYSVISGTPLLINDSYANIGACESPGSDIQTVFCNLQRELAQMLNSTTPISLNDIIMIRDKYIKFGLSLGTFKSLLSTNSHIQTPMPRLVDIAHKLKLKLAVLEIVNSLGNKLRALFENNSIYPTSMLTDENVRLLKQQARYYEYESIKCGFITWKVLQDLGDGNTIFGKGNLRFLIYIKVELIQLLVASLLTFTNSLTPPTLLDSFRNFFQINHLATDSSVPPIPNNDVDVIDGPQAILDTIDYGELESSQDPTTRNILSELPELYYKIKKSVEDSRKSVDFFVNLHKIGSSVPALSQTYGYFILLKIIAIAACFTNSVVELDCTKGVFPRGDKQTLDQVVDRTRKQIQQKMRAGFLDMGFSLGDNDYNSVENWLSTLFDDEYLFNSLFPDQNRATDDFLETDIPINPPPASDTPDIASVLSNSSNGIVTSQANVNSNSNSSVGLTTPMLYSYPKYQGSVSSNLSDMRRSPNKSEDHDHPPVMY